ncbi:MAG: hypothetical protein LAT76_06680 [Schleiferiaceae bacterium]|nr:hypothetical protein [Schleiferiaceae bacterium]
MKTSFFTTATFVLLSFFSFAQEPVLIKPDTSNYLGGSFGPNKKHYVHSKFSFGINAPVDLIPDMRYSPFRSWNIQVGSIYKYKVSKYFGLIAELALSSENMVFNQDDEISFSPYPTVIGEIERVKWFRTSLDLQLGVRINYQKNRGNTLGNFVDLGVLGGLPLNTRWEYTGVDANNTDMEIVLQRPEFVSLSAGEMPTALSYYYGAYTRVGFNKLAIVVRAVQYTENRWVLLPGIEFEF